MLNQNRQPLITVITSYYNDQDFLADAIQSVLSQTYQNFEYILVNHASEDRSRAIAHSFKDSRIRHIDLPFNYGASGNILVKKGLEIAHGSYIKLLCADDVLLPNALEILWDTACRNQADLVFGDVLFADKHLRPNGKSWFKNRFSPLAESSQYIPALLSGTSCFPYAGNLIKRTAFYDINLDYISVQVADVGMWLEILLNGGHLSVLEQPVALYRIHEQQMCSASQIATIRTRCLFEYPLYLQHYFQAHPSLELLKKAYPHNTFLKKLSSADTDLFPFVLAYELHRQENPEIQFVARWQMAKMLNDYSLQKRIEQKLGYTIKDLRQIILNQPIRLVSSRNPVCKEASLKSLSYYFFRKIIHILLFKTYRDNRKQLKNQEEGIV